ncbi:MAG: DUF4173 domain-containing protein [Ferruginibacter sp.]|nr:DUF4173 domain-containing protein [Ferruginibacter sp.]
MKPESVKVLLTTVGAIVFNIIFWQQKLGINAVFFDVFILSSVFYLYPAALNKTAIKWLLAGHIITVAAVIIQNTILSKLAFSTTLLLIVVFMQYLHRSVWYAAGSAFMNYVLMVPSFFTTAKQIKKGQFSLYGLRKALRFLVIPTLLLLVFLLLYNMSNSIFSSIINDIGLALQKFFLRFFDWFSWPRFWFLLLGLFVTGGLLLKSSIQYFSEKDTSKQDGLNRNKTDLVKWRQTSRFQLLTLVMGKLANGVMALRNENKTGSISLVLLNMLLLCINCIDVLYVWFGFKYTNGINLATYVHEGTGMLIFSIVLAMAIVLFFFRGNLNFYKKNRGLRFGAYAWLLQNMVLVISVLLRDYYYIVHMGLAYKRIGVLVFLLLVLFGLATVFIKIQKVKTTYFLLKANAWFAIVILVVASCVHWDEEIAIYNLARKNIIPLDIKFLLSLSDKTLPIVEANKDVLDKYNSSRIDGEGEIVYSSPLTPKEVFEIRKNNFIKQQSGYTWLSWNYADDYVARHLPKNTLVVAIIK